MKRALVAPTNTALSNTAGYTSKAAAHPRTASVADHGHVPEDIVALKAANILNLKYKFSGKLS